VTISLDGNATTGYRWTYDAADLAGIVAEVSNNYTAPNTGRMGSGGVFTFTFRGVKEGETVVRFRYERPWESGAAPARVAVYRMAVDRAGNITVREEQG
jgi:inhibitor of cysteine peptidase